MVSVVLHSAAFHGAIAGLVAAAGGDLHAFATWKSFDEAAAYSWGLAVWRWFQGAVLGALTGAGYGAIA